MSGSRRRAGTVNSIIVGSNYGQNDIVLLLFEFEDKLNSGELVGDAEVDGGRGTDKVHRVSAPSRPGVNVFKIKASFFLLKKYSHTLHTASH